MLGSVMMNFVDRDRGMDDAWLNNFLVDYGLNRFVNMMVDMLALGNWGVGLCVCGVMYDSLILNLSSLGCQRMLGVVVIPVVVFPMLDGTDVMFMLLWKHLPIVDRLHSMVVMILVDLLVNSRIDFLVPRRLHCLVRDLWGHLFVNGSVMVTRLRDKVLNCCLGFIHYVRS